MAIDKQLRILLSAHNQTAQGLAAATSELQRFGGQVGKLNVGAVNFMAEFGRLRTVLQGSASALDVATGAMATYAERVRDGASSAQAMAAAFDDGAVGAARMLGIQEQLERVLDNIARMRGQQTRADLEAHLKANEQQEQANRKRVERLKSAEAEVAEARKRAARAGADQYQIAYLDATERVEALRQTLADRLAVAQRGEVERLRKLSAAAIAEVEREYATRVDELQREAAQRQAEIDERRRQELERDLERQAAERDRQFQEQLRQIERARRAKEQALNELAAQERALAGVPTGVSATILTRGGTPDIAGRLSGALRESQRVQDRIARAAEAILARVQAAQGEQVFMLN